MNNGLKVWLAFGGLLISMNGLSDTPPSCPYESLDAPFGNAGCLVVHNKKTLLVTQRLTGRLSLPGGTADYGENSLCTAFRETWEETGSRVLVNELLTQFSNGFYLYSCELQEPKNSLLNAHDFIEVSSVDWVSPDKLSSETWRYPEFFQETLDLINKSVLEVK